MSIDKVNESSYPICPKRLGELLLEADLISRAQIEVTLNDQSYNPDLRFGEILTVRNWMQQETVDFFAEDWLDLIQQQSRNKIGWYLQQAALIKEREIERILKEQKLTGVRFGTVAVLQGLLKSTTLDFFLMYLFPREFNAPPFGEFHYLKGNSQLPSNNSIPDLSDHNIEPSAQEQEIDEEDIKWID